MCNKNYNTYSLLLIFSLLAGLHVFPQFADIIFTNGKIFTCDTFQPYVPALAVKGNKILATGSNASIEKLASSKTKKIDLQGLTVIPGFNDAHDHLGADDKYTHIGQSYAHEFSVEGLDKKSVLDSVARLVKLAKPNQWISGPIGMLLLLDTELRNSLDSIAPNNPVFLGLPWGYGGVANSKALRIAGISDTDSLLDFWLIRHPLTKKITGMYGYAQWPLWNRFVMSEPENLIKGLQAFSLEQIKHGITTVQNMTNAIFPGDIEVFAKAKLSQRIRIIPYVATTLQGRSVKKWEALDPHISTLVYASGVKYQADGSPLEQMALMKQPYPGTDKWYGRLNIPVDTIKNILREALTSKRQLAMHIVGDSTMAIVLSIMKQMAAPEAWESKRVRFEHNEIRPSVSQAELDLLKSMGVIMMHTPQFNQASCIRSLIDQGIPVGISPDGTTNPFWEIMVITAQQENPKENISREQAVIAYTKTNAFAEFKEKEKGTLTKGMLADLAVLSQDIFTIPSDQLPSTLSVLTMLNGKIVYQEPEIIKPFRRK